MNKIIAILLTLLTINFPIFAQISGLSLGPRYSKTVTGRTSLFGAPSYSYNKLHADGFMQFEEVRHAGYYLYVNANPVNVAMTAINGKITLPSSHPKEGPMSSVDFTIAQHDVAWPIIGKNKNLNLGLGYSFFMESRRINSSK